MFRRKDPSSLRSISSLPDQVRVAGLAVGGKAHQLVLAGVDLESGEVGEGRVEQAQGMREVQVVRQVDPIAPARSEAGGGPLADAVQGQDRGLLEGAGKEGAGRVRFVVLDEDVPALVSTSQGLVDLAGRCSFWRSHRGMLIRNWRNPRGA